MRRDRLVDGRCTADGVRVLARIGGGRGNGPIWWMPWRATAAACVGSKPRAAPLGWHRSSLRDAKRRIVSEEMTCATPYDSWRERESGKRGRCGTVVDGRHGGRRSSRWWALEPTLRCGSAALDRSRDASEERGNDVKSARERGKKRIRGGRGNRHSTGWKPVVRRGRRGVGAYNIY